MSLLQHHSSKALILWHSGFFTVTFSTAIHDHWKNHSFGSVSVLYCVHLCMKCSLGISNFLEEISSRSHSVVFLYFFALITEEGFLISLCYSLELCIQMLMFFLFSFAFCFSSFQSYLFISQQNSLSSFPQIPDHGNKVQCYSNQQGGYALMSLHCRLAFQQSIFFTSLSGYQRPKDPICTNK